MNRLAYRNAKPNPLGLASEDAGSGTVTAIALVAVAVTVMVAVGAWVQVSTARAQVQNAAESAVLATATKLNLGQVEASSACSDLETQAAAVTATVSGCEVIEWDVRATFTRPARILGVEFNFTAKARAGPEN